MIKPIDTYKAYCSICDYIFDNDFVKEKDFAEIHRQIHIANNLNSPESYL